MIVDTILIATIAGGVPPPAARVQIVYIAIVIIACIKPYVKGSKGGIIGVMYILCTTAPTPP